ncbi:hypothetical protein ACFRIB_44445 [Streptomyces mirabilis]|uniref:hypothetical protein n=1 Tax=Streptomyces mirabilis TaxID=68239 RepID=UPI0036B03937
MVNAGTYPLWQQLAVAEGLPDKALPAVIEALCAPARAIHDVYDRREEWCKKAFADALPALLRRTTDPALRRRPLEQADDGQFADLAGQGVVTAADLPAILRTHRPTPGLVTGLARHPGQVDDAMQRWSTPSRPSPASWTTSASTRGGRSPSAPAWACPTSSAKAPPDASSPPAPNAGPNWSTIPRSARLCSISPWTTPKRSRTSTVRRRLPAAPSSCAASGATRKKTWSQGCRSTPVCWRPACLPCARRRWPACPSRA